MKQTGRAGAARVAVVGASGIGRHHARWWTLEGATVCAIAGRTPESVARTGEALAQLCGFAGRGYADVAELLERERPDIVDICSPPEWHGRHVALALDAGCHVLCEKPFVYDRAMSSAELLAQARALVDRAAAAGRRLGICTQYSEGALAVGELARQVHGDAPVRRYRGEVASPARGRPADPRRVWIDLAPHPLSGLQALAPGAEPDWSSLRVRFDGYRAEAAFAARMPDGERVACEMVTHNTEGEPTHVRRIDLNGAAFELGAVRDATGEMCARIVTEGGAQDIPDMMRLLIRRFLGGSPVADGHFALRNLEWLLRILDAAAEAGDPVGR